MDVIFYSSPAYDGNPNGIINAQKGTQFYKSGSFYKINYEGADPSSWQNVRFVAISYPKYLITTQDDAITQYSTGSYLYIKSTNKGSSLGWTLLAKDVNAFVHTTPTPTPSPTPTATSGGPTPTPSPTPTSVL
jgi:hypothetical protein